MKKLYRFMLPVLAATAMTVFTACTEEEVDRYDTSRSALNIGFGNYYQLLQEATFNYSETSTERAVKFYARITGMPADHDRAFRLKAVSGDLTSVGSSYRFDTYVIPAGEVSGEYLIYFNPANLPSQDVFTTKDGEIVFKLDSDETFGEGALNQNELRVKLKNFLAMPEDWYGTYSYNTINYYFGEYSVEKHKFMIENGCPVNFSVYSAQTDKIVETDGKITISQSYANYLKDVCKMALREYNATHDTPLSDSYGNPISF